jgi:hypothetical protein
MEVLRTIFSEVLDSLEDVTPARLLVMLLIVALLIVHGLVPGAFDVDGISLALLGILVVLVLVPLLKSASLPGGARVRFWRRRLDRLKVTTDTAVVDAETTALETIELTAPVESPRIDPNVTPALTADVAWRERVGTAPVARAIDRVLEESSRSPKVGLMLLAAELDWAMRHLLVVADMGNLRGRPLAVGVRALVDAAKLPQSVASAVEEFASVRNDVVHGYQRPSDDDTLRAIDAGIAILKAIDDAPIERHYVEAVDVPLFADEGCSTSVNTAHGVIVRSASPARHVLTHRIFPTTRKYQVGDEVTWEWNSSHVWGVTWYRDAEFGVQQAWTSSAEFVGRAVED